jgi:hypothetical protein
MKKKKLVALLAATMLAVTSITGCGIQIGGITIGTVDEDEEDDPNNAKTTGLSDSQASETTTKIDTTALASNASSGNFDTLSYISAFQPAAATVEGQYNSAMYNLPEDYAFEFNYTSVPDVYAGQYFKVFTEDAFNAIMNDESLSFKDSSCTVSYSTSGDTPGTIVVKPHNSFVATTTGREYSDTTWGSYGKLYLVQLKDLTTGVDLTDPIITPFSTVHSLNAPVISQSVVDGYYTLSWDAVPGATSYSVYYTYTSDTGYTGYSFEASTNNTTITTKEFYWDTREDDFQSAMEADLKSIGAVSNTDGKYWINNSVHILKDYDNVSFLVVALDSSGNTSGFSNRADVTSIVSSIPYKISSTQITANISSILDTPTYADVEMADGSISQMVINYHGAQTYVSEDRMTTTIIAKVYNTPFATLSVKIAGMDYDTFMSQVDQVTARQDALVNTASATNTTISAPSTPSNEQTETNKQVKEAVSTVEVETTTPAQETTTEVQTPNTETIETPAVDNPSTDGLVYTPEGFTTYDLFIAYATLASNRLSEMPEVMNTMYATTDLEAWLAIALVANLDVIPVPTCVFPEAANTEYLSDLLIEAYRQNPTCGIVENVGYDFEYESLYVLWDEEYEVNAPKALASVNAAKAVATQIASTASSDYDKVIAINKYLCDNGEYDYDSLEIPEVYNTQFIDAHTPYGILLTGTGVCESYAESFILIARYLGLDVLSEVGTLYGGDHEWVRVNIDNNWYIVDPTSNDSDIAANTLLVVSDAQRNGILVTYDGYSYLGSYPATDGSKEYYTVNGMYATTTDEAYRILSNQLSTSSTAAVRLPVGTTEDQAIEIIDKIFESGTKLTNGVLICNVLSVSK